MDASARSFDEVLLAMDRLACRSAIEAAQAARGLPGVEALVQPALARLGDRWESGELALTQIYMAGRICEEELEQLLPPEAALIPGAPRVGLAVLLDHHQLGKRIVASSLRAAGFQIVDYGHGIGPRELAERALADRVPLLMVSVLMSASARRIGELRQALGDGPDRPRLVVGGAPFRFDRDLGRRVGADAVGQTGFDAASIAQRLLEEACTR